MSEGRAATRTRTRQLPGSQPGGARGHEKEVKELRCEGPGAQEGPAPWGGAHGERWRAAAAHPRPHVSTTRSNSCHRIGAP